MASIRGFLVDGVVIGKRQRLLRHRTSWTDEFRRENLNLALILVWLWLFLAAISCICK